MLQIHRLIAEELAARENAGDWSGRAASPLYPGWERRTTHQGKSRIKDSRLGFDFLLKGA